MKSKIWKQLTKYILPVLALVIAIPLAGACIGTAGKTRVLADTPSGTCGDDATWSFDEETAVLTISGTGAMYDFASKPWKDFEPYIEAVVVGDEITHIGKSAFEMCENISSLTIGEGVTSIGESAFYYCTGLTEVVIPNNVTSIGKSAFQGCWNISSLTIGEGVTSIGESAFYGCKGLTEVVIPNNVTSIGNYAFYSCENISSLTIGSGVTSIGESAFSGCTSLTEVVIPGSVSEIGQDAFLNCINIAHVYSYADPEKLSWTDGYFDDFSGKGGAKSTKCHVFPEYLRTYKDKFDSKVNVEFVGDLPRDVDLGLGGTLQGYSLSLEGDIGVKFYMDLTGVDLTTNPYMEFTVPNGSKAEKQTVTLENAGTTIIAGKTYHTFKCRVSAKDAASIIQAQLFAGEKQSDVYSFSVKSYAEYIISHRTDDQYARSAPLAEALLTYCTCAQKYFGVNMDALDASYIDEQVLEAVTINSDDIPQVSNSITYSGVTFEGATLSLKSETTLSLYFKSDRELEFSCSGRIAVEKARVGDYQVARIRGIKAADLGTLYTLSISSKEDELMSLFVGRISYSVLNYCKSVVSAEEGTYDKDLVNVAKSLYLYYEAAEAYASSST